MLPWSRALICSSSCSVEQSPKRSPTMMAKEKFCLICSLESLVKTSCSSQLTSPMTTLGGS